MKKFGKAGRWYIFFLGFTILCMIAGCTTSNTQPQSVEKIESASGKVGNPN